jgi:hypothetical protein
MMDFRSNQAWSKLDDLVAAIYKATQNWPTEERYGLTAQLRGLRYRRRRILRRAPDERVSETTCAFSASLAGRSGRGLAGG